MRRAWGMLVLGVTALTVPTACATSTGPLTVAQADIIECADAEVYEEVALGILLRTSAEGDATITAVDFADHDGISLTGSWIADDDVIDGEHRGYGLTAYPPDQSYNVGWADRVEAVGATVPADHDTWLVVRLHRDRDAAPEAPVLASGPEVTYTSGDGEFTATSNVIAGFGIGGVCDR